MRVLFVTTEFPWPVDGGGRRRTLSQLRALLSFPEVTKVTLLGVALEPPAGAAEQLHASLGAGDRLEIVPPVPHPIHLWDSPRHLPRVIGLRLRGVPYLVGKWDTPAMRRELVRRAASADVLYVDHLGMAAYLRELRRHAPAARLVLELHNIESAIVERYAQGLSLPRRRLLGIEARRTRAYERGILRQVDAVVAISRRDAEHCAGLASVPVNVVPMELALPEARPAPTGGAVGYLGSLRWHPNVRGLDWLCAGVWPLVRAALPGATLEIAGSGLKGPAPWRGPGVSVSGLQEDAGAIYRRCVTMVAPVFGGSGVSVKVLDAMAAGLPVVTTQDGAAGLSAVPGRDLFVARDTGDFARHLVALLQDGELRQRIGAAGRAFVATQHSARQSRPVLRRAVGLPPEELAPHDPAQAERR